ncbi:MAG: hypothetical protein HFH81_00890 [Lachnospiraceae bacterium]|nr:hypothetical protein [Lachnospiraceae bacterium]
MSFLTPDTFDAIPELVLQTRAEPMGESNGLLKDGDEYITKLCRACGKRPPPGYQTAKQEKATPT